MRLVISTLAAGCVLIAGICQAAHPNGGPGGHPRRFGAGSYNKQAAIGAYGKAVYPKYQWGFHSRDLQNVGVPHGDIGSLGSGLQRDPW